MAPPIFGPDQIDQNPGVVSLPTQPTDPNGDYWRNFYMQQLGASRPGVAFQTGNQDQARARQQQVIQDLQRAAMGDPNSRAQQGLRDAYGSATSQQSSLGSTMRGQSAGAAQRSIASGQQGIQRGFAGDSQMLQLQEQQAAQAMLAQLLAQQQGQDITQAQGLAQGQLGSQGLDDARRQFYMQGGIQGSLSESQLAQDRARAQLGFDLEGQDIANAYNRRFMGAAQTAAGTLASMPWGQSGGGFRQVDGQNSIVPDWDK